MGADKAVLATSAALSVLILISCSDGRRQKAAIALDEARLAISGARRAGAEFPPNPEFHEAQIALLVAEKRYANKDYLGAQKTAVLAGSTALSAELEIKARAASTSTEARGNYAR